MTEGTFWVASCGSSHCTLGAVTPGSPGIKPGTPQGSDGKSEGESWVMRTWWGGKGNTEQLFADREVPPSSFSPVWSCVISPTQIVWEPTRDLAWASKVLTVEG
jgi:hypothetical protein